MAARSSSESETRNPPLFKGDWNNNKCIEIAFSDHFPSCVKDIRIQKNIITRYLNLYLGGKKEKGLSVTDLAFAVISIMPLRETTETFIFRDIHYKEGGTMFFLSPEDKLKSEVGRIRIDEVKRGKVPKVENFNRIEVDGNIEVDVDNGVNGDDSGEDNDRSNETNDDNYQYEDQITYIRSRKVQEMIKSVEAVYENEKYKEESKNTFEPTTSSTTINFEEIKNNGVFKLPPNIRWFSKARISNQKQQDDIRLKYGPVENSAFTASCNRLLEMWDINESARIALKYFFGIVALILMRGTTKQYPHLVNTFESSKFKNLVMSHFLCTNISYSVPHKKCIKNSIIRFKKRDGNIPVMFAKIVVESFHIETLIKQSILPSHLNILKYTILSHTADFGFGLVGMLQNLKAQGLDLDRIIAVTVTYSNETAESWNRLKIFLEKYMLKHSREATHHWARVISTEFFRNLSCSDNYELSVILATFIEKSTGNTDVWNSSWVKSSDEKAVNIEKLKDTGVKMYKKYKLLSS